MAAATKYQNVDVIKMNDPKQSKEWNTLRSKVSTPYVLITRDIYHFTWLT